MCYTIDMNKQELIKAVKTCKEVHVVVHIHKHFCMDVKAVKADVLWNIHYETKEIQIQDDHYFAQMLPNNILLIG